MPHLIGGGSLLALKGESAAEELNRDAAGLPRLGVISTELISLPALGSELPVNVIRVVKGSRTGRRARGVAAQSSGLRGKPGSARDAELVVRCPDHGCSESTERA